jgi:hypothetical protein
MDEISMSIHFLLDQERIVRHWIKKFGTHPEEKIFSNTEKWKNEVGHGWSLHEKHIFESVKTITGLSIDRNIDVYILPAELKEAQYLNEHEVEWGYPEQYPNSISIGLSHEFLHCATDGFYQNLSYEEKWVFHAIIYLSIDEELRCILQEGGKYFDLPTIHEYHPQLIEHAKKILPDWKTRMAKSQKEDIVTFFLSNQLGR